MNKVLAILALCLPLLAGASAPSCIPSEFGGAGSAFVTSQSSRGWWIGWWCPNEKSPTIYACRYSACPSADSIGKGFTKLMTWPSIDTLKSLAPEIGTKDSVKDVWTPDASKLDTVKPK